MIKCIYIDGYNTIENGSVLKNTNSYYFDDIAKLVGCEKKDIEEHSLFFQNNYGDSVWEYHEIFWRSLVKKFHGKFDETLIEIIYDRFLDYYESEVKLFDDTYDTLVELSQYVKLILIANGNSKRLKRLIKKYNLGNIFWDYVISSETPYQKPNKFMFEYALCMYGWKPNEVLMVGDKYGNDIMGAKNCGLLSSILVSKNKAPYSCDFTPDFTIDSISDLKELVELSHNNSLHLITPIEKKYDNNRHDICAFIAAGGKGSRLGEVGEKTQKCMLKLWGKPLLYYTIISLKNAGCSNIILGVNHLAEQIMDYFGDGHTLGVNIEYIRGDFISTYDAFWHSLNRMTDRIIYVHANILFQNKLLENIITIGNEKDISVITVVDSRTNQVKHAQLDISRNGMVSKIDLTERNGVLPFTFLGVSYYKKQDFIDYIEHNNEGEIVTNGMVEKIVKLKLNKNEPTMTYYYSGGWQHIETQEDYIDAISQGRWCIYHE